MTQPYESPPSATPVGYALHHVQLALPPGGEQACRDFYVGGLGLTEVAKPPVLAARGGLWVRADGLYRTGRRKAVVAAPVAAAERLLVTLGTVATPVASPR